ncbi:hypothetical protein HELRODRAFT_122800, partial [Helobdella robusta]|uniref:Sugar phosphate transporter domain-containing protein n=1 Tax=Helobdella robusta TaxID=6412 RepID=T1EGW0_HELRO
IGFIIAFLYGACSASMAFVNKAVLSYYKFNFPFFLVSCQMAFTIAILEALRLSGNKFLVKFTFERAWTFLLPSIFYAANSVLSLSALYGMNIPMYGVIKRCAPVVILILGVAILNKPLPQVSVCLSVGMITGGCIVAGYGDLTFEPWSYLCGFSSVLSQAIYLLLVQKHASDFGAAESLHLNSFNTLPLLLIISLVAQEFNTALKQFLLNIITLNIGFILTFTAVIVFGCLLNYLLFLCTTYNSALTTSVTGTLKTILQTVVGMFTFGGITLNIYIIFGIILNFAGGVMYTVFKHKITKDKS